MYWPVLVEQLGDDNRLLLARQADQAHELQEAVGYLTEFFLATLLLALALAMGVALGRRCCTEWTASRGRDHGG